MPNKLLALLNDAGSSFFLKRLWHIAQVRSGYTRFRNQFPATTHFPVSLQKWRTQSRPFLFNPDSLSKIPPRSHSVSDKKITDLLSGKYQYFSGTTYPLFEANVWHRHPIDGYLYPTDTHWTSLKDFAMGRDIKYMWERSRFCHICDLIRHDHHTQNDHSAFVINEILDWIANNPLHKGPHYMSGQEVAIRVLNWLIGLHYYKYSATLSDTAWQTIMCSMRDQIKHISVNIQFAANLVRNNHLITESAALFVFGCLFPQLPESAALRKKGWTFLEREIMYQILPDGTYLQYSMHYHRIVVQTYTYALRIAGQNGYTLAPHCRERLLTSLDFLAQCTDPQTGGVPNYGHNDGAWFFPMNDNGYADFRPSIQALGILLGRLYFRDALFEDTYWFTDARTTQTEAHTQIQGVASFPDSGYYTHRHDDRFTFLRCGKNLHRPAQADQLHLDLWYRHENIAIDCGTYTYNGAHSDIRYFFGSGSHNTVMVNDWDQMLKGPRFLWYFWTKFRHVRTTEHEDHLQLEGRIDAFRQSGASITHTRNLRIGKTQAQWDIIDSVVKPASATMHQIWHLTDAFHAHFMIEAFDTTGNIITPEKSTGYHSPTYGVKIPSEKITFSTKESMITTYIRLR